MTREIKKELNNEVSFIKMERQESFEIYNKHFLENPEVFNHWNKSRYCCVYDNSIDIVPKGGI